jgi:hypothetical protein
MEPEYFSEELHMYSDLDSDDLRQIVFAMLYHLKLKAVKTNRTKHDNVEIIVKDDIDEER